MTTRVYNVAALLLAYTTALFAVAAGIGGLAP